MPFWLHLKIIIQTFTSDFFQTFQICHAAPNISKLLSAWKSDKPTGLNSTLFKANRSEAELLWIWLYSITGPLISIHVHHPLHRKTYELLNFLSFLLMSSYILSTVILSRKMVLTALLHPDKKPKFTHYFAETILVNSLESFHNVPALAIPSFCKITVEIQMII